MSECFFITLVFDIFNAGISLMSEKLFSFLFA